MKVCFMETYQVLQGFTNVPPRLAQLYETELAQQVLTECGIEVVPTLQEADVVVCCDMDAHIHRATAGPTKPKVVICERFDAATLHYGRLHVNLPQVTAVFKDCVLRDPLVQNTSSCDHRYHYWLLNNLYHLQNPDPDPLPTERLTAVNVQKIHAVPWNVLRYSHSLEMRQAAELGSDPTTERDLDVFFIAHTHEDIPLVHCHGREGIQALRAAVGHYQWRVVTEPASSRKEFLQLMRRAKVVVAPWGIGESIPSDLFALLTGAVLVKPDSGFMYTYPNIYTPKSYFPCKPEWSDLGDVVAGVLANYPAALRRTVHGRHLLQSHTHEHLLRHFYTRLQHVTR